MWCNIIINNNRFVFIFRTLFIMTRHTGLIKMSTTFLEGRLGLTYTSPSYRPTGTHPSPWYVLVWRSAIGWISLSSISRPTLCTHWSLTGNTAPPHWVVTHGRHWLVHRPPCRSAVIRKGSMLYMGLIMLKPGSVSSVTNKITVIHAIPVSVLVQAGVLMTPSRAETGQLGEIMETH